MIKELLPKIWVHFRKLIWHLSPSKLEDTFLLTWRCFASKGSRLPLKWARFLSWFQFFDIYLLAFCLIKTIIKKTIYRIYQKTTRLQFKEMGVHPWRLTELVLHVIVSQIPIVTRMQGGRLVPRFPGSASTFNCPWGWGIWGSMNGENGLLVTDKPIELEK